MGPTNLYKDVDKGLALKSIYFQSCTRAHAHTYLVHVELALSSGELPVAGAELSDKVVTTQRGTKRK